ncbi:PBP1A family penicillin-binding protein [Pacificimonas sp. WHA3]|uniref:PBP1A family penicillin-binding protein n=1 Tax=Pacificimonas pallii TaxID=2827236 RepID=A0ABS6SD07_9SPHN|nr:PBP1A family penicillin-binding protein [Pacificimonas pallii]MBV7255737.1 PBP1A family penicillin-binding protein [Pacificimonas pallii]
MARSSSPSFLRRAWGYAWKSTLAIGLLSVIGLVIAVGITMATLPGFDTLRTSPVGQAVRVKSADGAVLVNQGPSYGGWLSYDEIPPIMVQSMLAVEDKRFMSHPGIDPKGMARAFYINVTADRRPQGASTITQQLARNIFLSNERTYTRKLREALLALAMERKFTKQQIIELYLNRVYFGGGAYGIDAASRRFYGHSATQMTPAESAIIAGLVKAPSRFAPSADAERARGRADVVARLMEEQGVVSDGDAVRREIAALEFAPQPKANDVRYFTDWVLSQVERLTDETKEPLVVTTTLLSAMQIAAADAVKGQTPEGVQGALVSMSHDGAVRAMMGGRDYVDSNYNRATIAERQPGSAWKLFVYLAAIEGGQLPDDIVSDTPVTIEGWTPRNYGRSYRGEITMREAAARSSNSVAAQLGYRNGIDNVADMAERFGIQTRISRRPAMTLGTSTVRLIEMTAAYAAVARGGVAVEPFGITRIETANGRLLYERDVRTPRVLVAPWVATNMTNMLRAAVETGTGRAARIDRPVAGKTGTTSDYRDGYFVGFTGDITTGVWMGRDDNSPVPGLTGGAAPARAFAVYMRAATKGMPIQELDSDIRIDDVFAEPDAEVYGLDDTWEGSDWAEDTWPEDDYSGDETRYGDDFAPLTDAAGAGAAYAPSHAGQQAPQVGTGQSPGAAQAEADVEVDYGRPPPSDMRAADVPTRPRPPGRPAADDGWLDERAPSAAAPARPPQRPAGGRTSGAAAPGPSNLLPADPV